MTHPLLFIYVLLDISSQARISNSVLQSGSSSVGGCRLGKPQEPACLLRYVRSCCTARCSRHHERRRVCPIRSSRACDNAPRGASRFQQPSQTWLQSPRNLLREPPLPCVDTYRSTHRAHHWQQLPGSSLYPG